ncbi:hypothetical protein NCCP2140_37990 [Pseudoalteromonas sp. NCCP-2140]|nr:hypothetical protein NCCP2140_37990 [Pseudoalteromonas sp. NCCP-2140]
MGMFTNYIRFSSLKSSYKSNTRFTNFIRVRQLNSNAKKPLQQCNGFFVFWRKLARGKLARVKGEGSYQLVGWVERSETQQVSELRGERYEFRGTSCRRRFNAEKELLDISD